MPNPFDGLVMPEPHDPPELFNSFAEALLLPSQYCDRKWSHRVWQYEPTPGKDPIAYYDGK